MNNYIGVDLHFNQITYHQISRADDGTLIRDKGIIPTVDIMDKFAPLLNDKTHICVEASTCTYTFIEALKSYSASIHVINPLEFSELYCTGKKTDKIDAKKLANRIKTHIEDNDPEDGFPEIYIPDKDVQNMRSLFTSYKNTNKQIVAARNRIKGFFRSKFLRVKDVEITKDLERLFQLVKANEYEIMQINLLSDQLNLFKHQKEQIKKMVIELGEKRFPNEIEILTSIPGVGKLSASGLMADIADINRFKNHKKLVSYLRSAPRVDSSNTVTKTGKISKRGRKLSFSLLLQSIPHCRRSNPELADFYDRKCNGKSKGKVRAAAVRKLMVAIFYMLKNNELYKYTNHELHAKKMGKKWEKIKKIGVAA
jgi:transposase